MSPIETSRHRMGAFGAWVRTTEATRQLATGVESMGYRSLWIGGSPDDDLMLIEGILDATDTLVVITGVVNMWATDPGTLAASYHRVSHRHPDRFILGIGVGHRERDGEQAVAPYGAINDFLDGLDAYDVPMEGRLLAALGPRMQRLAGERSLGSHPYMTTPAHTAMVRPLVGTGILAPEQRVVITDDGEEGFALARQNITRYLSIANYHRNLLAMGYDEADLADSGSDRIIRDLAVVGSPPTAAAGLVAHLEAGADHVAVQVYARSEEERLAGFGLVATQVLPTG